MTTITLTTENCLNCAVLNLRVVRVMRNSCLLLVDIVSENIVRISGHILAFIVLSPVLSFVHYLVYIISVL